MRKTLLIFVGTVTGLALSLITTQPQLLSDGPHAQAAANASYHQLSLFKEVFELARDNYVEKPDESKLIKFAINGMLTGLDPHSSYMDRGAGLLNRCGRRLVRDYSVIFQPMEGHGKGGIDPKAASDHCQGG